MSGSPILGFGDEVLFLRSDRVLPLANLPPLLWEGVCAYLCLTDLLSLRLSCKRMKFILECFVGMNQMEHPKSGKLDEKWTNQNRRGSCFLKSRELSLALQRGEPVPHGLKEALYPQLLATSHQLWTNLSWNLPWAPEPTIPALSQPDDLSIQLYEYQINNLTW
jgi:hypothetical protein